MWLVYFIYLFLCVFDLFNIQKCILMYFCWSWSKYQFFTQNVSNYFVSLAEIGPGSFYWFQGSLILRRALGGVWGGCHFLTVVRIVVFANIFQYLFYTRCRTGLKTGKMQRTPGSLKKSTTNYGTNYVRGVRFRYFRITSINVLHNK